ncbi:MAG: sulfatase [Bacteroidota bacterium]
MKKLAAILLLLGFAFSCKSVEEKTQKQKPNILFLAVDDLRPELGCYGSDIALSPNIDALAGDGLLFERAYCQQAICSPSRASLMTGARPETINIIENYAYFREENPDIITLPQHLQTHGYEAAYVGKIYHGKFTDEELSWSRKAAKIDIPKPKLPGGYATQENQDIYKSNQEAVRAKYGEVGHYALGRGPAYEAAEVADQTYIDGYNTDVAIATMKEMLSQSDKPFFLGMGYRLPHLDWNVPKKYWDLYDPEKIKITEQQVSPDNGAAMGLHASFELRVRHGIPKYGPIEGELAKTLKHAYLASVSYVDAQIGRMLKALEEVGARENTIIILWSDHGWHLGDMGIWGKATNYEIATRVPMILWTPDMPDENRGKSTSALVELLDIYPSLCELAGISPPEHVEGESFASLLEKPDQEWQEVAFTQYPNPALREWAANPLTQSMRETYFGPLIEDVESRIKEQQKEKWNREIFENHLMGYAMRTDRYRLVLWKDRRDKDASPIFIELYDHEVDPEETKNIADQEAELVAKLLMRFKEG